MSYREAKAGSRLNLRGALLNRRFTLLLSAVVVVGLGLGAFIASITTHSGPTAQSVALAQGNAAFGQGQGAGSHTGSGSNGQGQGTGVLFGSVKSVDGNTLTVSGQQGDSKVNISGAKLHKTADGTTDDLKTGENVVVTGQQGQDGVLAASTIQIRPEGSVAGQGIIGGQGGQNRVQRQGQSQDQGQAQGQGNRPVVGSISSISGDTATLSTQQGDVKVKITGAKIEKTVEATASDLKAGVRVVVTGQRGQDGSYTASNVQIMPDNGQSGQKGGQPSTGNGASTR